MRLPLHLLILACTLALCSTAQPDGGLVRLDATEGNIRVVVLSSPTPLREGLMDLSVLVLDAGTGDPIRQAAVSIASVPDDSELLSMTFEASRLHSDNKLLHSALVDLPGPSTYRFDIAVDAPGHGRATFQFRADVQPKLPAALAYWPWMFIFIPALGVFFIRERLVSRRRACAARAGRPGSR